MAAERENPKKNNSLRDFQGINTQAARQVIGDDQFAWLENVQPIGFGNMPAVPGPSGVLASWSGTAYHMRSVTLNNVVYEIVFTLNGAVYAVNLANNVVTTVAPAGTLGGDDSEICQWENTIAVIVDSNGYYTWDGTTFTKWNGTVQSVTVISPGHGWTAVPGFTFSGGGGGSGLALSAPIQPVQAVIAGGGTAYAVNDVLTLVGGTSTLPAQLTVSSVSAGVITGVNITQLGVYTVAPGNPVSVTGGFGSGATFTMSFGLGPVVVTNPGSGYTSAPTATATGTGTGTSLIVNLNVAPPGGSSVTTYSGRVWVSNNRTISFSAPNSYNDFSTGTAGGSFVMVDETLDNSIVALRSANNFLYIVGDASVNVIADVTVIAGGTVSAPTATTVFSNTNISASIGTNYENSIIAYYRALWFANQFGVYALYGTTTQKMSDDLDGLFSLLLDSEGAQNEITAGTVLINNILCLCFLSQYADPVLGTRALLMVYFNKKWFLVSQITGLVNIDTAIINGAPVLYGTDGTNLYTLCSTAANTLKQTIITKLWDMGDPLIDKQALKFGLEATNIVNPTKITGTIDTELTNGGYPITLNNQNYTTWVNNAGYTVQWSNNTSAIVTWVASGYAFMSLDVETTGRYLGVSLYGTNVGTIFEGMHLQFEKRARWSEGGPL